MKPIIYAVLMFCILQNAYSQLLYPQEFVEYLPPYNKDTVIIGKDLEKWMKEELAKNYEKKYVEMKTDVKGRAKKSNETGINVSNTEYKEIAVPKQKRKVVVSDMHLREIDIEPAYGGQEYNPETKSYVYYFNGKKVSEKEYFAIIEKRNKKFDSQKKSKRDLIIPGVIFSDDDRYWIALMTAEDIYELAKNYKELAIDDYREPKASANVNDILNSVQLNYAHNNNYKGRGVGVYVTEWNCFNSNDSIKNPSKYTMMNSCHNGELDSHFNSVVSIVQYAAPEAHIFGYNGPLVHPNSDSLSLYSPPIEIGNHSYQYFTRDSAYYNMDANMDNYIYNNRIINFVAAGNKRPEDTTYFVSSPGKALNAITVGAVYPTTNYYTDYSKWKNSETYSDKPEIAMYTDIEMGSYSNYIPFGGTSAATPLAAGFLASYLENSPLCKRQPAMVKAKLINAEKIPIVNASYWDTDNASNVAAKGIVNYSTISQYNYSVWWDGYNSSYFDSNNEIVFIQNGIQAGKRYKIAIAWLTSGSYVLQHKKVSQNINLYVRQNGTLIAHSTSYFSPFEAVDFVVPTSDPLTITIKRVGNAGVDRVIMGYNINFNH
jgi:hypothetical protein